LTAVQLCPGSRIKARPGDGATGVELNASNAILRNLFDDGQNKSNGLVKAGARINADGTIAACWRCTTDTDEAGKLSEGFYEVDFTPLSTDVGGRPMSGVVLGSLGMLVLNNNAVDPSTVLVSTFFFSGVEDRPFVLISY
jgi:hypothetical protein